MITLKNLIKYNTVLAVLTLAACGGGGGGDNAAPEPTAVPTAEPTLEPTAEPTPEPTAEPTPEPNPDAPLAEGLAPGRSSTIALTSDDTRLLVVNREQNSVSVIQVKDASGTDVEKHLGEVYVGNEPRYVAISPDNTEAYVANTVDGTVSVVDLASASPKLIGNAIKVGTEPRGIATSPNGAYIYVANFTEGTVSVISSSSKKIVNTIEVGGNPQAIAISNDGDDDDFDEYVYVTRFFSEVIDPINRPDGFNDAKAGKVVYFNVESSLGVHPAVSVYSLSPLANAGFAADRRQFCQNTRDILQLEDEVTFFNSGADGEGDGAAALKNEIFCPDPTSTDASPEGVIAKTAQGAYTNNLFAMMLRNNTLYIPNVGASPEPPVKFNVNVQALISSINLTTGADSSINLNDQIKREVQPSEEEETASLDRLFGNDIVAIDANAAGDEFLIVSRGGNYVLRAGLDGSGNLDIAAPAGVVRFKTGNIPSGIVMSRDGKRAYTNNEVSSSVTAIDLENNAVLSQDIASSEPPVPGSQKHRELLGKLVFYTALGTPDTFDTNGDGSFDVNIRDIDPIEFRNKASDNAWSSCASCHEDGHSDNVTWIFPTGPRQTIALEGTFGNGDLNDQRILNWNAVRGSVTDFNNNSRGVQGGKGFATDVNGENKTGQVFNHGPTEGISDALDAMTEWVAKAVRTPIMPDISDETALASGREAFVTYCSSCHNGAKWTKSTTALYQNNPTFEVNPIGENFFAGVSSLDPALTVAGPQIRAVELEGETFNFLENVGSLFADNQLEIRGAGAIAGQSTQGFNSLSVAGAFNVPSLLGTGINSPYLHDGSAVSLDDVFAVHTLPDWGDLPVDQVITDSSTLDYLADFVFSIDEQTPIVD